MSDIRAQLLAEVTRADWQRRLEHERRVGGVISAPEPPGLVAELVEECAARLGVKRRGADRHWPAWIYAVGFKYLRGSLKAARPRKVAAKADPKQPPRPRGRGRSTWAERLAPAMETPEVWVEFPMGTTRSARVLAHKLGSGMKRRPVGRWEFCSTGNVFKARYLGPEPAAELGQPGPSQEEG